MKVDISPDSKLLDKISRAVIIEEFSDDNGLTLSEDQKLAMMELIKNSAEWGRDHLKKKYYVITDKDLDSLLLELNKDIAPGRKIDPEQRQMYLAALEFCNSVVRKWIKAIRS